MPITHALWLQSAKSKWKAGSKAGTELTTQWRSLSSGEAVTDILKQRTL